MVRCGSLKTVLDDPRVLFFLVDRAREIQEAEGMVSSHAEGKPALIGKQINAVKEEARRISFTAPIA